ncbi:alpha/beta fold hydrolase [Agromyces archimandritae]|uniref:Alpha/beta fold hydrolase n=1 Tax=Agromyces archimandritae TaxID=2781962 RepID=A0A975FJT9_9MICO|nr:alpha/beta fold hydrolase [Agromyces archimandritae]QTX03843.1 alpha/beta fold hydrolase [Agromyces archimandritae]
MTVPRLAAVELGGPRDARPLLLGPSLGTSTILWRDAAPRLGIRRRIVAWDLPGHGAAPAADADFTVGELADALAGLIDELGGGPADVAGVSLGGAVTLELALRHPERVRRAVIMCSGAKIATRETWTDRAAAVRTNGTSPLVVPSAQRWFAPGSMERHPVIAGELLHALQDADDESYARCCDALADYDVRDALSAVAAPVLAVWGEHDQVTPEAAAREVADGVPHGRAVGVADAAHLVPAEQPEAAAALIDEFLEEQA